MLDRVQLWSCGGGRQSAGIAALIAAGELPRPDHASMIRLEWEAETVWPYVERFIIPAMDAAGVSFTIIDRAKYATHDFWGGADGATILLPVFSDQSGEPSKLPEFCSGEWKRDVGNRWAAEQPGWKARRRRGPRRQWIQPAYPLLDVRPTSVLGCLEAVRRMGWPEPPRSRCRHCPNQSDREWAELTPAEFAAACDLDDDIRKTDPHAFLHKRMVPLRMVTLEPKTEGDGLFTGGCSAGTCY